MLEAVRNKVQRAPYLDRLEQVLGNTSDEKWQALVDEPRPDNAWAHLREALADATLHCFPTVAAPEVCELVKRRIALLGRRREIRGGIVDEEAHAEAQLELTLLTRRLRKLRDKQQTEKEAELIEQIWSAWKPREFARMHRLRSRLSRTGLGPKKRNYLAPRQLAPTAQQW